jgi:hypothetical protein
VKPTVVSLKEMNGNYGPGSSRGGDGGNSGGYTIDHIINDCIIEKSRLDSTRGRNSRGRAYYDECWNALNTWIESRLKKRLGASVSPLGDFSWEIKIDSNTNERICRPIFLVHESFVKDHHLKQKYFHQPNEIAKCEEVNYSNLAIKYSKTLTKDMIFSGIRDILKKIGDYLDRIYEIEINFSFGILFSKERRIRFEFDQMRLLQILPDTMTQSLANRSLGYDTMRSDQSQGQGHSEERQSDNGDDGLVITTTRSRFPQKERELSLPDLSFRSNEHHRPSTSSQLLPPSSSRLNHTQSTPSPSPPEPSLGSSTKNSIPNLNLTYKTIDRSIPPPPLSPGLKSLLLTMNNPTLTHQIRVNNRIQCCDDVAKQAFSRCLSSVENSAIDEDYIEFQRKLLHKEWLENEKLKKDKFKKELVDIQDTLRLQMNESNQRKLQEISDRKQRKIHFGLPGQVPPLEISQETIRKQKEQMLKGLQKQILTTTNEMNLSKNQLLYEENIRLKHLSEEEEIDRLINKSKQLEKQRDLLEAWERDAHVKNLQKLIGKGKSSEAVKSYITNTGLVDEHGGVTGGGGGGGYGSSRSGSENGNHSREPLRGNFRLNDSAIGFDTRRK